MRESGPLRGIPIPVHQPLFPPLARPAIGRPCQRSGVLENSPDACNVYKDLEFSDEVYQNISEYHEAKERAES